jgi:hypothetical protein
MEPDGILEVGKTVSSLISGLASIIGKTLGAEILQDCKQTHVPLSKVAKEMMKVFVQ